MDAERFGTQQPLARLVPRDVRGRVLVGLPRNENRRGPVGRRTVTELAAAVAAPARKGGVTASRAHAVRPRDELGDVGELEDSGGRALGVRRTVAELTTATISPAADGSVAEARAAVSTQGAVASHDNLDRAGETGDDLGRRWFVCARPVA